MKDYIGRSAPVNAGSPEDRPYSTEAPPTEHDPVAAFRDFVVRVGSNDRRGAIRAQRLLKSLGFSCCYVGLRPDRGQP